VPIRRYTNIDGMPSSRHRRRSGSGACAAARAVLEVIAEENLRRPAADHLKAPGTTS
jgi:4-aminobutyrate aminotransferase-like enzyme